MAIPAGSSFLGYWKGRSRPKTPVADRFWARIKKLGPNDCWRCQNIKDGAYGYIKIGQRRVPMHVAAYELLVGPIPLGDNGRPLVIMHSCDTPGCCNPSHLSPGTQAENLEDMVAKGRSARGNMLPGAKLTPDQARAIVADHRTQEEIARQYGVTRSLISIIKSGKAWGWATGIEGRRA